MTIFDHVIKIAIIITALIIDRLGANKMLQWAGRLFTLGIVLFAGSLYVLSIADVRQLGIITPFGGVCFLGGMASFSSICQA